MIICAYCKRELLNYQKVGKGGLINLYIERVIDGHIDFEAKDSLLVCPFCRKTLGIKKGGSYKMIRGSFNKRVL